MKKTITGIAALLTSVVMLTSCGAPAQPTAEEEAEVRETVTSFMDALTSYDEDEAKKYVTDESLVELPDMLAAMEEGMGQFEGMLPDEDKDAIVDKLCALIKDNIKYEITDVKFDGDKATAEITATVPDISDTEALFTEDDLMGLLESSFGFDLNDPMAIVTEYANRKGVDVTEISSMLTGDQDEFMKDFYQTFSTEFNGYIDGMIGIIDSTMKSAETSENTGTIELEKQPDGKWLITNTDGLDAMGL